MFILSGITTAGEGKTGTDNSKAIERTISAGQHYEYVSLMKLVNDTTINKLSEQLAQTPPMGWNSWNWFGKSNVNEKVVREVIDAMVKEGLRDAGYNYIVVDGGWRDTTLGPNGELRANPRRFPGGMKALADYAHSKGFKFGLHTVPGTHDCGGDKVGGYGHEEVQLQQFIDWGLDFIKLDKCKFSDGWNEELLKDTYFKWSSLIKKSGKKIILSVSAYKFRNWNPEVSQMSRTTGDIMAKVNGGAMFDAKPRGAFHSVMDVAEENNLSAKYAGPGYWNDADMLVTGAQGLSLEEQQVHFALWCIMSSPLFLGNDPRFMSEGEKDIILNKEAIKINQDTTEQGKRIRAENGAEIWAKKLAGGKVAVLLLNRNSFEAKNITLYFNEVGIAGKITIKDVYGHKDLGSFSKSITRNIKPLSGLFLIL